MLYSTVRVLITLGAGSSPSAMAETGKLYSPRSRKRRTFCGDVARALGVVGNAVKGAAHHHWKRRLGQGREERFAIPGEADDGCVFAGGGAEHDKDRAAGLQRQGHGGKAVALLIERRALKATALGPPELGGFSAHAEGGGGIRPCAAAGLATK